VPDERRAGDVELQALYLSRVRSIRLLCFLVAPLVIAPNKETILLLGEIAIVDRLDQGVNKAAGITIGHCRTDLKRSSDRLAVSFMDKALQCRPERRLLFFGKGSQGSQAHSRLQIGVSHELTSCIDDLGAESHHCCISILKPCSGFRMPVKTQDVVGAQILF